MLTTDCSGNDWPIAARKRCIPCYLFYSWTSGWARLTHIAALRSDYKESSRFLIQYVERGECCKRNAIYLYIFSACLLHEEENSLVIIAITQTAFSTQLPQQSSFVYPPFYNSWASWSFVHADCYVWNPRVSPIMSVVHSWKTLLLTSTDTRY